MSEESLGARLWAAYLHRGYTRATFAAALGKTYATVDRWDTGESLPDIKVLMDASALVGFTLDQLCFGRERPDAGTREVALREPADWFALLEQMDASYDARAALGEHLNSPAGRLQRSTRTYLVTFVRTFEALREKRVSVEEASTRAAIEADRARAAADAIATGKTPWNPALGGGSKKKSKKPR